ncbi:3'-5' exonuclease [Nesterenkonia sp. LB17]|uniref:3'-5' exonuclease n=1 Tax=unclassified Nesterenkonia TaxID=2629769 RepID=UPI001F4CC720|nr:MULTISPECIES: 3'-5' exonuclease [unclassified Nesterenkonia]MCH8559872.1 3'-5' exonuclease [Nesterenkonia sp. DZ6]MCH8562057.1 3'-5' exonuclease [Nesterenkonia sp. YGD6]MCH8564418.1 3'-5' exonuclease [Nesterenkonia sp. LB17]
MAETPTLFEITPSSESWHTRRRVGFDLETTSRDPRVARIVSAALVIFDDAEVSADTAAGSGAEAGAVEPAGPGAQRVRTREWLVDPGVEIPAETTAIHGISTEYAQANGQPAAEAVAQITTALAQEFAAGSAVVVMNAPYDFTVLQQEALRHGVEFTEPVGVIDPLVIDKQVDKYRRGKRTLSQMCLHYEVELDAAHSATPDAWAAVEVACAQAQRFPQLQIPAPELHRLQAGWKVGQSADLQEYLRRTRPDAVVSPAWPV